MQSEFTSNLVKYFLCLALMSYRIFRYEKKVIVKVIHLCFQIAAFIFAVTALLAVFDFHNHTNKPNITSLHSWIGMVLIITFGLQVRELKRLEKF